MPAAPPVPAAGIAAAPPEPDVVCGIMLMFGDAGMDVAFVPALPAVAEPEAPAAVPAVPAVEGVVLPAAPADAAAVGGCIAGSIFAASSPLQAAHARANPSEAPSRKTRAHCTWSSITPLLW
jgi:hypothetical protein